MHTQNRPISKKFLLPLHLFEPESEKMGVFLKRKLKSFHLFEMGNDSWGGVFENIFEKFLLKTKNLLPIYLTERREWFGIIKL